MRVERELRYAIASELTDAANAISQSDEHSLEIDDTPAAGEGKILTAAMMLEHTGLPEAAARVEAVVSVCLEAQECTRDVGGELGTSATGDAVARRIRTG